MEIKELDDDIYHCSLTVITNCSYRELDDWVFKKYKIRLSRMDSKDGMYFGIAGLDDNKMRRFIWFKNFSWTVNQQILVVHELFHFISSVLRDAGLEHTSDTEEAYTYYLDYWISKVYRYLLKRIKVGKPGVKIKKK